MSLKTKIYQVKYPFKALASHHQNQKLWNTCLRLKYKSHSLTIPILKPVDSNAV